VSFPSLSTHLNGELIDVAVGAANVGWERSSRVDCGEIWRPRRPSSTRNEHWRRTDDRRLCQPTADETPCLQDLCQSIHRRKCQSLASMCPCFFRYSAFSIPKAQFVHIIDVFRLLLTAASSVKNVGKAESCSFSSKCRQTSANFQQRKLWANALNFDFA